MINDIKSRVEWIEIFLEGKATQVFAAKSIGIGERQFRRIVNDYLKHGVSGLVHGLSDKPSNSRYSEAFKDNILNLVRYKYFDCSPTLASELILENEGLSINPETLRLWMRQSNLQLKTRKRKPYRQRRERKEAFGQMLQIDGSFHKWFSGEKSCLLNLIDDATSYNLCFFDKEETSYAACMVLWMWIKKFGVPLSIYCDRRNAYISSELLEASGFFGQMCKRLQIKVIPAFSPQAKGRIERSNATHQGRLIPKLRLQNITTIDEANRYLQSHYIYHHNKKFAFDFTTYSQAHRELDKKLEIDDVCYIEEERKVNNDWTVKFKGKTLQITRKHYCPAKSTVTVRVTINGKISLLFKQQILEYKIT